MRVKIDTTSPSTLYGKPKKAVFEGKRFCIVPTCVTFAMRHAAANPCPLPPRGSQSKSNNTNSFTITCIVRDHRLAAEGNRTPCELIAPEWSSTDSVSLFVDFARSPFSLSLFYFISLLPSSFLSLLGQTSRRLSLAIDVLCKTFSILSVAAYPVAIPSISNPFTTVAEMHPEEIYEIYRSLYISIKVNCY